MTQEKLLLTIEEVAKLLDISSRHLKRLCKNKQFPEPIRLGRCVRWHRAVVDNYVRSLVTNA